MESSSRGKQDRCSSTWSETHDVCTEQQCSSHTCNEGTLREHLCTDEPSLTKTSNRTFLFFEFIKTVMEINSLRV